MINRPHDALFKRTFGDVKHAAGLLRSVLPRSIVRAIDWHTLHREPGSFVDPKLADRLTDLLFSATLGQAHTLIYVLAEHQSTNDRDMPLRMLRYMLRIWEAFRRDNTKAPLPVILPVVVAHPKGGWSAPRSMDEMFDPAALRVEGVGAHVPRFTLLVDDLATLSDDALRARTLDAMARLALVMLRDSRQPQRLLALFATWRHTFRALLASPHGSDMLRSLLIYIATVSDLHFEQIRATIHEHLPEAEPTAVTTARQLIQQGLEQGLETGRKQTVLRMLALKFGPLDEASTQRVELASAQELDQLLERALQAATLSDALQP